MPEFHERREYARLKPQSLVFVVFRPDFRKIGSISNVSRGGLGFKYLCPAGNEDPATGTPQIIDIISSSNSIHISEIPCTLIHEAKTNNNQLTFMHDLVSRCGGLKFGPLTKEKEKQIDLFLDKYAR